ncbi:hypothetical protein U14_05251 [Candidatus Moduliflexus flocculans]|uniref:Uncharacterized protein n=1 Tax=Candidatus Moduliflexus flocculans TaxID=1499966 RepID=A0A081BRE3_9BACT|nr:hypothetical protein U14_05251 [Candidatus Moduliflexus flocculans]
MNNIQFKGKLLLGVSLLIMTGYALLAGNETLLPSALVISLLFFGSLREQPATPVTGKNTEIHAGKAARMAIATFAVFMAVFSLCISLFLPAIAVYFNLTGLFDGDFVRVTINDAHEFAYATVLLLLLDLVFYAVFMFRQYRLGPDHN